MFFLAIVLLAFFFQPVDKLIILWDNLVLLSALPSQIVLLVVLASTVYKHCNIQSKNWVFSWSISLMGILVEEKKWMERSWISKYGFVIFKKNHKNDKLFLVVKEW